MSAAPTLNQLVDPSKAFDTVIKELKTMKGELESKPAEEVSKEFLENADANQDGKVVFGLVPLIALLASKS